MMNRRGFFSRLVGAAFAPLVAKFMPKKANLIPSRRWHTRHTAWHTAEVACTIRLVSPDGNTRFVKVLNGERVVATRMDFLDMPEGYRFTSYVQE